MQRVSADRLGERLPPDSIPQELAPLAAAFNDMLARLEDSFRRLSEFSSDLAHELRTPISNLMTQTQVALARARTADEYREILYSNLEEYERLSHMTSDMLFLAKARQRAHLDARRDHRSGRRGRAAACVLRGACRRARRPTRAHGARDAHAPTGTCCVARSATCCRMRSTYATRRRDPRDDQCRRSGQTELSVENPGTPIAPEQLPRLFDRFYRVDASRRSDGEGAGLGLAIAKSIVEAHGGSIWASSADGTFRFAFTLPSS